MSDCFPDEGLDIILAIFPRNGSNIATLYAGLFTSSNGGSAVPAASATIASMGTGYAECQTAQWSSYARQPIAAASWGAVAAKTAWGTTGRGVDAAQVSFPAPASAYNPANPICGFFIADSAAVGAGHAIYYSNFSDTAPIASLAIGDVVKVTPAFGFGN